MTHFSEAINTLIVPLVVLLLGQFLVLLIGSGYLRRVVKDHDESLKDHKRRIRALELHCAEAGGFHCRYPEMN